MDIADILTVDRIATGASPASKKRALEQISELITGADSNLSPGEIFDSLLSRERLGSTGIGHGVAIPHGRIKGSKQSIGAFLQLVDGIDYDAIDNAPVDLMFALLVPEESTDEHLRILARLAEMFSDESYCDKLRKAQSPGDLFVLLTQWQPQTT
ncbi:MAG: PTS IIA-like nitrogen regulatory protein PtsN [Granulosicoccaceae bacterium]|jgi:PTS system nitrogen regulatory IIA component